MPSATQPRTPPGGAPGRRLPVSNPGPDAISIEAWIAPLRAADPPADHALLSRAERTRAAAYLTPEAIQRFVRGRAVLRRVVGAHLGLAPASLPLMERSGLAPRLLVPGTQISLSRCEDLVLVVISNRRVGADIERLDAAEDGAALARAVLPSFEVAAVEALLPADAGPEFVRAWTRREAWLKAHGTGFAMDSGELERILPVENGPVTDGAGDEWWLLELRPTAHHVAVIAVERAGSEPGPPAVAIRRLEDDPAGRSRRSRQWVANTSR